MQRLKGIITASLTPFDARRRPNGPALVRHCRDLLSRGCDAVLCLGTTGEANSLTVEERLELLDLLGQAGLGPRLMVGVGCCAVSDTVKLIRKALAIQSEHVLALPPFYYKAVSDDGLFAAYAQIIEEVGDQRMRLHLYHIPQVSGVPIRRALLERLLGAYPKTVAGIKDSAGDWGHTAALIGGYPELSVFSGTERHLLANLRIGGPGCISATFNLTADLGAELLQRRDEDQADALQERITALRAVVKAHPLIPAIKAAMTRLAEEPEAWGVLRPPLLPLPDAETAQLVDGLARLGFPS